MGRKKRNTALDDMVGVASRLPWWLGIALALMSYVVLSWVAGKPAAVQGATPGHVSNLVIATMIRTSAEIGQYLLPVIFLTGAFISLLRTKKNQRLMTAATGHDAARAISGMSWREFELLMAEAFRRRGFGVEDRGGQGPDGGIDLVLVKGTERHLVQCKQWRATKVGVAVVRELYGVMSAEGAAGGFVVTSGAFTQDAAEFARGRNIQLVDGAALFELLETAKQAHESTAQEPAFEKNRLTPVCPKCHAEMTLRRARKGPQAGKEFWGCTRFPDCRGALPFEPS